MTPELERIAEELARRENLTGMTAKSMARIQEIRQLVARAASEGGKQR